MNIAAKLDDFGRPAWIGLTVLGFVVYWPVGLAILLFSLWRSRNKNNARKVAKRCSGVCVKRRA